MTSVPLLSPLPLHPRQALFDPGEPVPVALPVCDHYAGVEVRMRKSLELQAELGPVFDVTLDGEDGAAVGGEIEHTHLMAELVGSSANRYDRVGARLQPVDHPRFEDVVDLLVRQVGQRLPYLMIPKPAAARPGGNPRRFEGRGRAGCAPAHRVTVLRAHGLCERAPWGDSAVSDERDGAV